MPFCPQCGHSLAEGTRFCTGCGAQQTQTQVQPAVQPIQPAVSAPQPESVTASIPPSHDTSDMELRQMFAKMSGAQLLPWLHKAEAALNALLPAANQVAEAEVALNEKKKVVVSDVSKKSDAKTYMILCAIAVGLLLLFQLVPAEGIFIDWLIRIAQGISWFIIAVLVIAFIVNLVNYSKLSASLKTNGDVGARQYAAEVAALEADYARANANVDAILTQHSVGQRTRLLICPKECKDPHLLRIFISYVETGRANNLNEALNLFETYMHRMYMERQADAQLQAAQAAEEAAREAYAAASRAESEASAARTSARNAEYYARWK